MAGQPLLTIGGNVFLLELRLWAYVETALKGYSQYIFYTLFLCKLGKVPPLGWWTRKKFPGFWGGPIRKGAHSGNWHLAGLMLGVMSWIVSFQNSSSEVLTPNTSECNCTDGPWLMMFWLMIFPLSVGMKMSNLVDTVLWILIFSWASDMLDSGSKPQLPDSHVITRVNNWYSTM